MKPFAVTVTYSEAASHADSEILSDRSPHFNGHAFDDLSLETGSINLDAISSSRQGRDLVVALPICLCRTFFAGRAIAHYDRRARYHAACGIENPAK